MWGQAAVQRPGPSASAARGHFSRRVSIPESPTASSSPASSAWLKPRAEAWAVGGVQAGFLVRRGDSQWLSHQVCLCWELDKQARSREVKRRHPSSWQRVSELKYPAVKDGFFGCKRRPLLHTCNYCKNNVIDRVPRSQRGRSRTFRWRVGLSPNWLTGQVFSGKLTEDMGVMGLGHRKGSG